MKKLSLVPICALWVTMACAQTTATKSSNSGSTTQATTMDSAAVDKDIVRTAANLKSGTAQDVLSSFFKLAYNDLSDGHHFQFNSSLFAIKAKTDPTLWRDDKYKNQVFARNFSFGVDFGLDSSFKFKSSTLNIKYAIVNQRDKNVFNFDYGKTFTHLMDVTSNLFGKADSLYFKGKNGEFQNQKERDLVLNFFFYHKSGPKTNIDSLPPRYRAVLDSLLKESEFAPIKPFRLADLRDSLNSKFSVIADLTAKQPLWTIGSQLSTNQSKLLSKTNFNTEFLKGITNSHSSMGLEMDIKFDLNIYDTTAMNQTYNRSVLSGSAGINWIIWKDSETQKSHIEFKPALTYNNVLGGILPAETKSKFAADGILRFRITDDLWIPVDIKYDPKAGKFFGFLNITSNFDWLGGGKSKTAGTN